MVLKKREVEGGGGGGGGGREKISSAFLGPAKFYSLARRSFLEIKLSSLNFLIGWQRGAPAGYAWVS